MFKRMKSEDVSGLDLTTQFLRRHYRSTCMHRQKPIWLLQEDVQTNLCDDWHPEVGSTRLITHSFEQNVQALTIIEPRRYLSHKNKHKFST